MISKKTKLVAGLALLASTVFVIAAFKPQTGHNKYLTVRTYEGGGASAKIVIVHEDGGVEELELESFLPRNVSLNAQKINGALNKVASQGYELVSANGGDLLTMYTFVKK